MKITFLPFLVSFNSLFVLGSLTDMHKRGLGMIILRVPFTQYGFLSFFGCMVASRGGYRMARGRHYAKFSLSNAALLSFSDLCILLFLFLSLCRLCVCVFLCSHWSLVYVPLIFFCPADHVPDWQPRVLLGRVEAR